MILTGKTGYKRATQVALFVWVRFRGENEIERWVWIRAEIKNEIAALEKKMKCGPSICGMGGIQIWQCRICAVCRKAHKKRVWISPYTLFRRPSGRHLQRWPHWAALRRPGFGIPLALTRE